ncbi:hypothetical protein AVEN_224516-1 [Araneus ventricosus]|uniref:Uncharacterized protein n=1 Tax=Araneus ventricosus TaxID=182803 RepID=A0A4Y2ULP1_ARAVE|nr:hypothetical protein AVEN_224516-1 [Araneus ventricosus]
MFFVYSFPLAPAYPNNQSRPDYSLAKNTSVRLQFTMDKKYGFCCFLFFVHINLSFAEDPRDICPPQDIIDPCFCEKICVNCHVSIRCHNLQNHEIIPRVLNQSRDYQYESLEITNATIMFIPASIFEIKKLTTLYVFTSKLVSVFDHPPSMNYNMEVIMLNGVTVMRGVQWEMFAGIQKLGRLKLMYSPVRSLDRSFRDNVPRQLEELDIYNCTTETVDDQAFSSLTNLLEFSLEYGKVREVKRSMFPNPAKVRSISLGGTRLRNGRVPSSKPDPAQEPPGMWAWCKLNLTSRVKRPPVRVARKSEEVVSDLGVVLII